MSSLSKYRTLISNISNWTAYFKRASLKGKDVLFITRGRKIKFILKPVYYYVFREIFMEDFYNAQLFFKALPPKPFIVDIGANGGLFTFFMASKIPDARFLCCEPMAENIRNFSNNIALNPGLEKSIILVPNAVTGSYNGPIDIFFDEVNKDSVASSLFSEFDAANKAKRTIEAKAFKDILAENKVEKIDLLKLDCEGSEYAILYESPAELWNNIQMLLIESHEMDNEQRNTNALCQFLETKGYRISKYLASNGCYSVVAGK